MGVEAYHNWGCGALNGTAPCGCGEGLTVEAIHREAEKEAKAQQALAEENRRKGIGLSMPESLARLDQISKTTKGKTNL